MKLYSVIAISALIASHGILAVPTKDQNAEVNPTQVDSHVASDADFEIALEKMRETTVRDDECLLVHWKELHETIQSQGIKVDHSELLAKRISLYFQQECRNSNLMDEQGREDYVKKVVHFYQQQLDRLTAYEHQENSFLVEDRAARKEEYTPIVITNYANEPLKYAKKVEHRGSCDHCKEQVDSNFAFPIPEPLFLLENIYQLKDKHQYQQYEPWQQSTLVFQLVNVLKKKQWLWNWKSEI